MQTHLRAATFLILACSPAAAFAEVDLDDVTACITNAQELDTSPLSCVDAAHAPCLQISRETPNVATLCFKDAQQVWSDGIAAIVQTLGNTAPDIAKIAQIEAKYDLLGGLLQCDRMAELAALQQQDDEQALLQKTRCSATASGLAYTRLRWRAPAEALQ